MPIGWVVDHKKRGGGGLAVHSVRQTEAGLRERDPAALFALRV